MKVTRTIIVTFLTVGMMYSSFAQTGEEWEKNDKRSMESMVFDVVGDKEIRLSRAVRTYDPIPPQPYERINSNLNYSFKDYFYGAEPITLRLRPKPVAPPREEKLYGNYLKAGLGNYATPYADIYLANKRQREYSFGARFNYLSSLRGSVDGRNSGEGRLSTGAFGSAFGEKATVSGSVSYSRDDLHYYGYVPGTDLEPSDIKQSFNRVALDVGIANTKQEEDFQYNAKLGLKNLGDHFDAKETSLGVDITTTLQVMEEAWMHIDAGVTSVSRNDPNFTGDNRLHFFGKGGLTYKIDNISLKAMLRVDYIDDTLANMDGVNIYPVVAAKIKVNDKIVVSGRIDGGMIMSTLNSISAENPFIGSGQYISATNKQLGVLGRIDGAISSDLGLSAGVKYSRLMNSHYFINNSTDQAKFDIAYDSGVVSILNPFIEIKYNKDEIYRFGFTAEYFGFSMGFLDQPWHKPTFKVGINGSVLLVDKIRLSTSTYVLGGIQALEGNSATELDGIVNLNIGVEYITGSRFNVFLNGGNLLGKKYMIYNNYPSKGVQIIGGIAYKF